MATRHERQVSRAPFVGRGSGLNTLNVGWLRLSLLLVGLVGIIPHSAWASVRLAVVIDERVAGEIRGESDLEGALLERFAGTSVVFVDPARTRSVREAAAGQPLGSVDARTLVSSLDADVLVVGEVELEEAAGGGYVKGLSTLEAVARLRVVAVDSAEVLGALRGQAVGSHFSPKHAEAKAATELAAELAPKLGPLLERDPRIELVVDLPGPVDVTRADALARCVARQPGLDGAEILHLGPERLVVELRADLNARALARRLSTPSCGLAIRAFSARELLGSLRLGSGQRLKLTPVSFAAHGKPRRKERWMRTELPLALAAELEALQFLEVGSEVARTSDGLGDGLALTGSFSRGAEGFVVSAQLKQARSGRTVLAEQRVCAATRLESCTRELAAALREGAFAALEKTRSFSNSPGMVPGEATVKMTEVAIDAVLPVRIAAYEQGRPLGQVRVTNGGDAPVQGLTITARLERMATRPSVSEPIDLAPGTSAEVPIRAWLDRAALAEQDDNRAVPIELTLSYAADGYTHERTRTAAVMVLDRHALDWGKDPLDVASFIVPRSAGVGAHVRVARAALAEAEHPLAEPVALFEALRGLRYQPDAANPHSPEELDDVRFPAETLADGGGDCDDLAVLYAALLEEAGWRSALVQVPGHVLAAVAAPEASRAFLGFDPDASFEHGGRAWIPVETTALEGGFAKAWLKATELMRSVRRSGRSPTRIEVREAWRAHPPVDMAEARPAGAPRPVSTARLSAELAELEAIRKRGLEETLARLGRAKDAGGLNELGVQLALDGRTGVARSAFGDSLSVAKTAAAHNNLGNLEVLEGHLEAAIERYDAAIELETGRVELLLNAVLASYLRLRESGAQEALTRYVDAAIVADPDAVEAFLRRLPGQAGLTGSSDAVSVGPLADRLAKALHVRLTEGTTASRLEPVRLQSFLHWER